MVAVHRVRPPPNEVYNRYIYVRAFYFSNQHLILIAVLTSEEREESTVQRGAYYLLRTIFALGGICYTNYDGDGLLSLLSRSIPPWA